MYGGYDAYFCNVALAKFKIKEVKVPSKFLNGKVVWKGRGEGRMFSLQNIGNHRYLPKTVKDSKD